MARGKKAPSIVIQEGMVNVKRVPYGAQLQWVVSSLDAGDKKWLRDNINHSLEYVGEFVTNLTPSFTLTLKFEDRAQRYLATLVCTDSEHPAASMALSCRGATPFDALYAMAYLADGKYDTPWWQNGIGGMDDPWG